MSASTEDEPDRSTHHGPMRSAIRATEWSATRLGPREDWPKSLSAAVDMVLLARHRMAVCWGPDFLLLYNDGYRELLGGKHPSALGQPTARIFAEVWDTIGPPFRRVMTTGEATEEREQLLPLDRGKGLTDAWFDYTLNPIPLDDGTIGGILVIATEVTERVRAAAELRRLNETLEQRIRERTALLSAIAQGTEDMIAAEDPEYRFLFFNDAYRREFTRLWGREPQEGTSMLELMGPWPEQKENARALWSRALAGESFSITTEFGPSDEQMQVYDLRFNPLYQSDGSVFGAAHILRNVTAEVRLRDALQKSQDQLREASRRKDEFLAMLGHELRNPLGAVRSATELLDQLGCDDSRLGEVTGVLERQTRHMTRLVDGLLDVSRIARGKIELQRSSLDLRGVVRQVIRDSAPQAEQAGVLLKVHLPKQPVWVDGDAVRLTQVSDNLVSNAIRFTGVAGQVMASVSTDPDPDSGVAVLEVSDDGVGMEPEVLDQVFEPFHQGAQGLARSSGGLGLGLALAKGLVELHQGRIQAFSKGPGQGSRFRVELPLAAEPNSDAGSDPLPTPSGLRVLIVEDNVDFAMMLRSLLAREGHRVATAEEGKGALAQLRREPVDVVLCDLGLPGMSGHEVAQAIRADPKLRRVGLVAVSGYGQRSDRLAAEEAGFDVHLTKPVDLRELRRVLSRLHPGSGPSGA